MSFISKLKKLASIRQDQAIFTIVFFMLSGFILYSQEEIYLANGDDLMYIFYASKHYWGTTFLPGNAPLTSLWMLVSTYSGVRFRDLQELFYIVSVGTSLFCLRRVGISWGIIVLICFMEIFAPIINYHLNFAMSDGIYTSQHLLLFSSLTLFFCENDANFLSRWVIVAGIIVALMLHTRMEVEYIIAISVVILILMLLKLKKLVGCYIFSFKSLSVVLYYISPYFLVQLRL